jgi:ribosomal protein S12 methylthiotransferase accessory factor
MGPHLRRFGITRVANVTGLDHVGIPVVLAIRPNARSLSLSQGKGVDLQAAKVSAIMEAVEHHSAERTALVVRWASQEELTAEERVVDVSALPQFKRRYQPRTRIMWTLATELTTHEHVWVPHELVHLDFTVPLPPGSGWFLGGSNGLASGNHPLEALLHGLAEVIERDALSLFYQRTAPAQQTRRICLDTIDDALCNSMLERYERADVAVAAWDATSDVGVPVYLCGIVDRAADSFRSVGLARGAGCDPDPAVALLRALTEAAQSRLTRITGSRDDLRPAQVAKHRSAETVASHRLQILAQDGAGHAWGPVHMVTRTLEQDVLYLRERLAAQRLGQVLIVDQSPADCPVHVLRVLVPGLEGTAENPGYHPGERARRIGREEVCA